MKVRNLLCNIKKAWIAWRVLRRFPVAIPKMTTGIVEWNEAQTGGTIRTYLYVHDWFALDSIDGERIMAVTKRGIGTGQSLLGEAVNVVAFRDTGLLVDDLYGTRTHP